MIKRITPYMALGLADIFAAKKRSFLGYGRPLGGEAGENDTRRRSKKVLKWRRRRKIAAASKRRQRR